MKPTHQNQVPRHVAIIMDGNGRWAKQHGVPRLKGHEEGTQSVEAVLRACKRSDIQYLTLYAFSTENWVRPPSEIKGLMQILAQFLKTRETDMLQEKIRLRAIGRLDDLPRPVRNELQRVMKATEHFTQRQLILALSYGGRDEITQAVRAIARRVQDGKLAVRDIDEALVARHLFAPDVPDPDLLIRTSGEMRLSNFMLWQASYTELYITETLWPDFREDAFAEALAVYARRQRRFGQVS
ncbi:MAG: isoprenyl transferase [Kiritimatiellaeota bacterium]|nr:isoprenyl transferase [Kiritimatiellota bacterium]